jgi:hypothetical protein
MTTQPTEYQSIVTEISGALTTLRRTLRVLLDRLMPQSYGVRSFGRALGLEVTTAWRCWTIAHVADASQALKAIPGARAWESLLSRLASKGATPDEIAAVRAAIEQVNSVIRSRKLSHATLRVLAAGGLDSSREAASILEARRSGMRAGAKLYGVHCKTRMMGTLVAPGTVPGSVALGFGGCFDGLERTRPGMPWPIMELSASLSHDRGVVERQLSLGDDARVPAVISTLSTGGIIGREIRLGHRRESDTLELGDVSPDRREPLRLFHAEANPNVGMLDTGDTPSFSAVDKVLLPTEMCVIDLLVHRRLPRLTEPAAAMYATSVSQARLADWFESVRIPLEARTEQVDSIALPRRLAPLNTGYRATLERIANALSSSIDEYDMFRLELPYPPTFCQIATTCEIGGKIADAPLVPRRMAG